MNIATASVYYGDTEPFSSATRQQIDDRYAGSNSQAQVAEEATEAFADILRIIPLNAKAKLAFDYLVQQQTERILDQHHSQFIVTTRKEPLETITAYSRPGDETTDEDSTQASESDKEIHHGYFRINFDCQPLRNDINYIIGRGSGQKFGPTRNVDILLAAPRSPYTHRLHAVHAFLKLHPESGAWMLCAGDDSGRPAVEQHASATAFSEDLPTKKGPKDHTLSSASPAKSLPDNPLSDDAILRSNPLLKKDLSSKHMPKDTTVLTFDKEPLSQRDARPLIRPSSTLELAGMQYEIRFMISKPEQEALYQRKRDEILIAAGIDVPVTIISGIPFDGDQACPSVVFRHGIGSGTFGKVFEGFSRMTGDLRVVKKITLLSKNDCALVDNEIRASQQFSGYEGIVTMYEYSNSAGGAGTFTETYPLEIYIVQEKGDAFNRYRWTAEYSVDWKLRATFFRQLLTGLTAIHEQGYMHRDITPMNILYFRKDPKHVGLCDFGKFCWNKSSTETALAAWPFLPPEIQDVKEEKRKAYNQEIDVWMLALSLLHSWFPQIVRGLAARKLVDHATICETLRAETDSGLAPLLLLMLSRDPRSRPSAEQALNHPCLRMAVHQKLEASKSSDRKRFLHE